MAFQGSGFCAYGWGLIWVVPIVRGTILGIPIIRTIVYWGLYGVPLIWETTIWVVPKTRVPLCRGRTIIFKRPLILRIAPYTSFDFARLGGGFTDQQVVWAVHVLIGYFEGGVQGDLVSRFTTQKKPYSTPSYPHYYPTT